MIKILVYGKTVREARKYCSPKEGVSVGARTYDQYDNGEKYDQRIVIDKKQLKKKKTDDV